MQRNNIINAYLNLSDRFVERFYTSCLKILKQLLLKIFTYLTTRYSAEHATNIFAD